MGKSKEEFGQKKNDVIVALKPDSVGSIEVAFNIIQFLLAVARGFWQLTVGWYCLGWELQAIFRVAW